MKAGAIAAVALLAPSMAAAQETLELVCRGNAVSLETTQTYGSATDSDGDSVSGSSTSYRRARSTEQFRIRLDGAGGGKVKMPPALVPPISRGKDGWWDFTKLDVTDDQIRGEFSMNWVNKPKVRIDRRTGDIDVKGYGFNFSGSCEKAENAEERKF